MANLSIRRGEQREQPATVWDPLRSLDPFRMIRDMLGTDPFAGLVAPTQTLFEPDIEIKETKDTYVIKVDVPGVREGDLEVSMVGNRLMINGRREEEQRREDERFFVYERCYGTFSRSFVLPEGADPDRIKAELNAGVLSIAVPKRAEMQARRVEIGAGKEEKALGAKGAEGQKAEPGQKKAA
jgi:HSP20 family protein